MYCSYVYTLLSPQYCSGPIRFFEGPKPATLTAISLPSMPLCPGTQLMLTTLCVAERKTTLRSAIILQKILGMPIFINKSFHFSSDSTKSNYLIKKSLQNVCSVRVSIVPMYHYPSIYFFYALLNNGFR